MPTQEKKKVLPKPIRKKLPSQTKPTPNYTNAKAIHNRPRPHQAPQTGKKPTQTHPGPPGAPPRPRRAENTRTHVDQS